MDLADALVGGAFALAVSFLTSLWNRQGEKERRAAELVAEKDRWDRQELARRTQRGEDAAKDILTTIDETRVLLADATKEERFGIQKELQPLYLRIQQQAELLTDDEARSRIVMVADNLYYFSQAQQVSQYLTAFNIAWTCSEAAHLVLRAYLHGQPIPATPRLDRLQALHVEGGELLSDYHDDEPPDPLDDKSEVTAAEDDAQGSGSA